MKKTKKLSAKTVRMLKAVRRAILLNPERYDQSVSSYPYTQKPICDRKIKDCGTPLCILGWVCYLFGPLWHDVGNSEGADEIAGRILGLDDDQCNRLWHVEEWPLRFQDGYDDAFGAREQARAGADRITHFIKTNGLE